MTTQQGNVKAREAMLSKLIDRATEMSMNNQAFFEEISNLRSMKDDLIETVKKDDFLLDAQYLPFTEKVKVSRTADAVINKLKHARDSVPENGQILNADQLNGITAQISQIETLLDDKDKERISEALKKVRAFNEASTYQGGNPQNRHVVTGKLDTLLKTLRPQEKLPNPQPPVNPPPIIPRRPRSRTGSSFRTPPANQDDAEQEIVQVAEDQVKLMTIPQMRAWLKALGQYRGFSNKNRGPTLNKLLEVRSDLMGDADGDDETKGSGVQGSGLGGSEYDSQVLEKLSLPQIKKVAESKGIALQPRRNKKTYIKLIKKVQEAQGGSMGKRKKRVMSEEQKQVLRERLAKARAMRGKGKGNLKMLGGAKPKITAGDSYEEILRKLQGAGMISLNSDL